MTVDLEQQTIECGNRDVPFTIDPVRRMRLLNGWDDIALTESYRGESPRSRRPIAPNGPGRSRIPSA